MRWLHLLSTVALTDAVGLLGIDYGADYVKSSLVAPNSPFEVVLTPDSQRKDASGLVITPTDFERLYGSRGVPLQSKYPQGSLYGLKTLLGVPFGDMRMALFQEMHPGLDIVNTTRNSIAFNISGEIYTVEEAVAMQLRDIAQRATELLREKTHSRRDSLQGLAVSVPGSFGSLQRQALIDSATLAGVDLSGLVSDGVAAGLNYANSPAAKLGQNLVVFDVGASSASATLLRLDAGANSDDVEIRVLGYGSDLRASGQSLTLLIREMLLQRFNVQRRKQSPGALSAERTPRLLNRLWREAERAKHVLSANNEVHVHMDNLEGDFDLDAKITREEFEVEAKFQRERISVPLTEAISSLPNGFDDVDQVVLVGGASRTPFVIEELKSLVGEQKLSRSVNADEANVQGASMRGIQLARLFRTKRQFDVTDAVSHPYTVEFEPENRVAQSPEDELEQATLFEVGAALPAKTTVSLPTGLRTMHLLEGRKRIARWELPYTQRSLESLKNESNCLTEPTMEAYFSVSELGVVKLDKVEARCEQAAATTSMPPPTDVYETGSSGSTGSDDENTTSSSSSSSSSAPSSSATGGTATKRISIKPVWEQAPIGISERAASKSRLQSLDARDTDRQAASELHHELETLAYKMRADTAHADLSAFASDVLEFLEEGGHSLEVLQQKLTDALKLYASHTGESESEAESEAEQPVQDSVVEDEDENEDENEPAESAKIVEPEDPVVEGHDEL